MSNEIILYGVGDLGPKRENPDSIFEETMGMFKEGDISFGQLEPVLSLRGTPLPQSRLPMRCDTSAAKAFKDAGFDIISFATNHCMDWGREAFFDTIDALKDSGLKVIGAGKNIEEARKSVIIDCKGVRVAFLGYNSILPQGYQAEENRQGCAPLRGLTLYEQIEHDQPGTPCKVHTYPHRGDMSAMTEDIKNAKAQSDLVVVSVHWGIHFIPAVIADYQRDYAHAAIDSGADLILGHHTHILKGIEVYKGKAIFYSLANYALDPPHKFAEGGILKGDSHQTIKNLNPDWKKAPEKALPADSFKTIVAKCYIEGKKIKKVTFLPTMINDKTFCPKSLRAGEEGFTDILEYMKKITAEQGIDTAFEVSGDEILINTNDIIN